MAAGWRKQYSRYKRYFLDIYRVYNQKPDVKMFLEILLTLGVVSFFGAFALRPTILTIIDLNKQIQTKEETLETMETKIQNLSLAQELYAQEINSISLLDTALPERPSPELFIRQLETLAQQSQVAVLGESVNEVILVGEKKVKIKKTDDDNPLPGEAEGVSFSISVSGSYTGLSSFLENVLNLRHSAKLDSVSINASQTDQGRVLVLVVSGRIPFIK